ncbi:VOC family protein [Paenibacillus mesophilus]|uniref:VOC family protein n=1 Tax=Paenibacillus mesophilus TaxID=2582849 RepID=UPI00110DB1DA|nr:VOC family protein [Paenibacillus mesophilus]TMV48902.1 VOC family protein [Paenibacillus mesophilus]
MSQQPFIEQIHYFRIPVTDLDASVQWYTDILGLKVRRRGEGLAVMELQEDPLLVLVQADAESRGHFTIDGRAEFSVGFTSPDIHNFRDHLIGQEVEVDEMKEDNGHYFFHFFDPSGNKLQAHW